jgi:hypothetical protein
MKTTKWPVFILIAYFVINILVIFGITQIAFYGQFVDIIDVAPFTLILAAVLLICQVFLFDIKVDMIDKRPVPKRKITTASIFLGLLMAAMTFTGFILLLLVGARKDGPEISPQYENLWFVFLICLFVGSWIFWAWGFIATYKNNIPGEFMRKSVKRLMAGSVMELIIAVPSHILFRNRGDCCAPMFSYFGIVMGTTVLLFAFGPGIVFLYLKRMNDKRPRKKDDSQPDSI